jgi:spore coat protein U-like protein
MKMQIITLFVPLSLLAFPLLSLAATANTNMEATATVSAKCNIIKTSDLAFASVDPTTNGNYDGVGTIKTHCSKGTMQSIYITTPASGFKMSSTSLPATGDGIVYAIYTTGAYDITFPSSVSVTKKAHSGSAETTNVYGRVVVSNTQNNSVTAGNYSQSLTVNIEW